MNQEVRTKEESVGYVGSACLALIVAAMIVLAMCAGCHSTTTVKEYSIINGVPVLTKETVSDEHIVKSVDDNLRNKAVFTYVNGMHIGIEAKLDPQNGGTPTGEIKYKNGKFGLLTMPVMSDSAKSLDTAKYIAPIIAAVDPDMAVTFSGVKKAVSDSALSVDE